ncbi:jg9340 [Pararge aegeria aegeria]|uniref:Jg9340 protein n=1 Tax=Pararge aegeria aegeria TaxID=348720 RepID=A0A8S4RZX5_9NEOP|nr:jg9340 [Pararge aegeria aegeria]
MLPVMTYDYKTWSLTKGLMRRLTQRAMERAMLGVSLRNQIRNEEIRRRTTVTNISQIVAKLKNVSGNGRGSENRWTLGPKVLEWRPRTGKRSVGRSLTRRIHDIKLVPGKRWHKTVVFGK